MSNTALLGSYGAQDSSSLMFRNRIINGDMRIDQRNAGAAVTFGPDIFSVDRWKVEGSANSKMTAQQSSVAPAGFTNSILLTTTAAYAVTAGDFFGIFQPIEGFNVADLAWGTANAQSVTISFWVRSSLTGAFGGAIENGAGNRAYPFTYSIASANTWEQKTVTIPGDTTGTWLTNNGRGLVLRFGLGVGSTYSGPAGAWSSTRYFAPTGATSLVGTNGATLYITGVQLEAGPTATPFERRPIGVELGMAMRYYQKLELEDRGIGISPTTIYKSQTLFVPLRTTSGITLSWVDGVGTTNTGDSGISTVSTVRWRSAPTLNTLGWSYWSQVTLTVNAEL